MGYKMAIDLDFYLENLIRNAKVFGEYKSRYLFYYKELEDKKMKKFIVYWLCLLAIAWILITLEVYCRNPLVNVGFGGFILQVVGGFTVIFKLRELIYGK